MRTPAFHASEPLPAERRHQVAALFFVFSMIYITEEQNTVDIAFHFLPPGTGCWARYCKTGYVAIRGLPDWYVRSPSELFFVEQPMHSDPGMKFMWKKIIAQ